VLFRFFPFFFFFLIDLFINVLLKAQDFSNYTRSLFA